MLIPMGTKLTTTWIPTLVTNHTKLITTLVPTVTKVLVTNTRSKIFSVTRSPVGEWDVSQFLLVF